MWGYKPFPTCSLSSSSEKSILKKFNIVQVHVKALLFMYLPLSLRKLHEYTQTRISSWSYLSWRRWILITGTWDKTSAGWLMMQALGLKTSYGASKQPWGELGGWAIVLCMCNCLFVLYLGSKEEMLILQVMDVIVPFLMLCSTFQFILFCKYIQVRVLL